MLVAKNQKTPAALKSPVKGTAAHRAWSRKDYRRLLAELKAHLADGLTDLEAAEKLFPDKKHGADVAAYNVLKRELYQQEKVDLHNKTTEEVFVDYVLRQEGCLRDLNELIRDGEGKVRNSSTTVGAIRAKSEILDKIISRGQEFGILEKVPEKKQVIAGVMVANLDNDALRSLITKELGGLQALVQRYGGDDMLGKRRILEMSELPPGPSFTAENKPKEAVGGLKKAAGAKAANAARRVKVISPPPEDVGK
jgi:hypothetical protein